MSCRVIESLPGEETQSLPWMRDAATGQVIPRGPARTGEAARLHAQLEELTVKLDQQTRAAFEQGFREGEAATFQKFEAETRASLGRLSEAIAEIPQRRTEAIRRAEGDIVRLTVAIARRVVHRELSVDAGALEGLIKAALDKVINHEVLRVRVHPAIEKVLAECIGRDGRGRLIEILSDPSQPPGGVIFEIARGALDASVDTQLREIERGLIDEMRGRT
jgi:flagellar assembly protein FliH